MESNYFPNTSRKIPGPNSQKHFDHVAILKPVSVARDVVFWLARSVSGGTPRVGPQRKHEMTSLEEQYLEMQIKPIHVH